MPEDFANAPADPTVRKERPDAGSLVASKPALSALAHKVRREVDANLFPFDDSRWRIGFDGNGCALVMQETRPERPGDAEGEAAMVGDPLTPEQFAARMGVPADAVARLLDAAWQSSLQWDW